eukprot:snap_masked-scaffold_19-processed-gene-3.27-mRNA-1 protein AED:1.00 eAED:1.00 QI:0/-1/0/0/-1/1/1/0/123
METSDQHDHSLQIKLCSFVATNPFSIGSRMLMLTCLIKGIAGPSKRISTLNKGSYEKTTQVNLEDTSKSPKPVSTAFSQSEKSNLTLTPEFLKPSNTFSKFPSQASMHSYNPLRSPGVPVFKI